MTAAIIAVLATAVGAYLIGRHRNIRGTVTWKKGCDFGRRAGLRERDELNARLLRLRQENDALQADRDRLRRELADLAATGQELIAAIRGSERTSA